MRTIGWLAAGCGLAVLLSVERPLRAADAELPILVAEDFEQGMDRSASDRSRSNEIGMGDHSGR